MRDLVCLVPDNNVRDSLRGIFSRYPSLGIRTFDYEIYVHPERDAGCYNRGHEFLRQFASQYRYALLVFDHHFGLASDQLVNPDEIRRDIESKQNEVEYRLNQSGWDDRCRTIIIHPEVDVWVWSDSPHVDTILGWENRDQTLRAWLKDKKFLREGEIKPTQPKEALEAVLFDVKKPRSSTIYEQIAKRVTLSSCTDPAFICLRDTLQTWFSPDPSP